MVSCPTPVIAWAVCWTIVPTPPKVAAVPINLLAPICLINGFVLVSSLAPKANKLELVLNISAGKATKLPKGKALIFFITWGTLL